MTNFWPLTFGMISFWVVAGVIDLITLPKSVRPHNAGSNQRPGADFPLPAN